MVFRLKTTPFSRPPAALEDLAVDAILENSHLNQTKA